MPDYVYSIFTFLGPQISLNIYVNPQTNFNAPSTPPLSDIHTVHIPIHCSFNTTFQSKERCGAKQSLQTRHKSQLQF